MKTTRALLRTGLLLCVLFVSCEEVIELDLDTQEPQLVIAGFISDGQGPYTVRISRSVAFYDTNNFPVEEHANVRITSDEGITEVLTQTSPGVYQTAHLRGQRGVAYTLDVALDGTSYSATSRIPAESIALDSIQVGYKKASIFQEAGYYAIAYFKDPPDVANYYRLQVLVNGEEYVFRDDEETDDDGTRDTNFWLLRDKFTDGNVQDYEFPHRLAPGDTLHVRLQQVDRITFDYYRTLVDVLSGGGIAPANPITNWDPEVLGYFGALSETETTVVVPEEQ
ncbi:DUF4249 domain-containing protein [Leeuwenhoekiella polynyae]|uniref:DUF4249 domain-containing protein n=1 Tax=Leeuwenhoekiella polynyae TaxID=1550906 RepID=A0A4Q0NQ72_9FLAO|nr:DUF4249 domain-containing protein [Leeuwenhoekiella polynyae]RXG11873.1 putative protein DUF4249 [Leeuwenhoekiella polynyae]